MSVLFGIDFPSLIDGVFSGQLELGTLETSTETIDDYGQPVHVWTAESVEGVVTAWDERVRVDRGYPAETIKIMLLAHGISKPANNAKITMRGQTFRVIDTRAGGAEATWAIAGVPA